MGQSPLLAPPNPRRRRVLRPSTVAPSLCVFVTDLGWFGLVGADDAVHALTIGHGDAGEVRAAIRRGSDPGTSGALFEKDWHPRLRADLQAYAAGNRVDFSGYRVLFPSTTPFRTRVLEATRRIAYGRTLTYAQLAEKVGCPRGARAVGNVMASNRVPILIPCHRVVARCGLGGFSAPQGVSLKDLMLRMERGEAADQT